MAYARASDETLSFKSRTQPIFTESFWVTLPTDIMLTLISHALSLKEIPALQKFLDGKFLGSRFEYFSRTLANTLVNSSVIVATWSAFGININKGTVGAAVALCAAVYSVLQITKPFLFKTVPQKIGKSQFQEFQNLFPEASEVWTQVAKESLPLEEPRLEMHFVYALENIVLNILIEGRLKPQLVDPVLYQKAFSQKEKFLNDPSKKNYEALRKLRLDIIKNLLGSLEKKEISVGVKEDIVQALKLDSELTPENSIRIHRYLIKTRRKRQAWFYTASFIDQAISVGIAGGIFLYSTTHWALTGVWPL